MSKAKGWKGGKGGILPFFPFPAIFYVAIYNRTLTADELKTLMDEGLKGILAVSPNGKLATLCGKVNDIF